MPPIVLPEITVRPPEEEPPPPPPGPSGGSDPSAWAPEIVIRDPGGQAMPFANAPPPAPPEAPSLPSDDNILTRTLRSVWDLATGESRQPDAERDIPEWGRSDLFNDWQKAGLFVVAASSTDPKALEDAALARLPPGAKITEDAQGNRMVQSGAKKAYLNKPGFSGSDFAGVTGYLPNLGIAAVTGGIGALGGRTALNTIIRSAAQAGAGGATELAKSGASIAGGSNQGIDWRQVAEGAAGAGLGEPVAAVSDALRRGLVRSVGRIQAPGFLTGVTAGLPDTTPVAWDQINRSGQRTLGRLGYNANNLPPDFTVGMMRRWAGVAPTFGMRGLITGDTPDAIETARRTLLEARYGQAFTLGQRTGDPAQLAREDFLRRGGPEPAKSTMNRYSGGPATQGDTRLSTQQERLQEGGPRLMQGRTDTDADYADRFRTTLLNTAAKMDAETQAAYGRVTATTGAAHRELPFNQQVNFTTGASQDVLDALQSSPTSIISPASERATRHVADLLESPSDPDAVYNAITKGGRVVYPPRLKPFNLGDYNETRRKLSDLYGSSEDPTSRHLIRSYIRALDDAIDNAPTRGTMMGAPDQIQRLSEARDAARREFAAFKPENPEVAGFLDRIMRPGISARDTADALIGVGNVGSSGSTAQILDHLHRLYPAGSPAREQLRDAFKSHMIFGTDATPISMSPGNMANRFNRALDGRGKGIMADLLTPGELEEARSFRDMLRIMQETGKQNPSNTAYVLANWLRGSRLNPQSWIFRTVAEQAKAERDVVRATAGQLPAKMPTATDQPIGAFRRTVAPVLGTAAGAHGQVQPAAQAAGMAALHPVETAKRGMLHFYNWDKP